MEYGISGLPGAGKTLSTIHMVVTKQEFANREIFYHRIPVLMLDYEVCCSFQGWFYGWYFHNNKQNTALSRKVRAVHKKEDRLIEPEDFPYLQKDYEDANPVEVFLYWVRRIYPDERLAALDEFLAVRELDESQLTFDDIRPLNLHWVQFENPKSWVDLPSQSVIVMDEIHHYWPTRTRNPLPPELEAISTHRHDGKDLVFITQDFANVDIFIRRMMNYHTHYEFAGADRVACFKRKQYIDINNPFDKKAADKSLVKRPVHLYGSYYSTELDTNDNKLSKKAKNGLILGAVSLVVFLLVLFFGLPYVFSEFFGEEEPTAEQPAAVATQSTISVSLGNFDVATYQPKLDAIPWSAPLYQGSLEPASYPDLMCYLVGDTCRCVTQQATAYTMDNMQCQSIARNGLFDPYLKSENQHIKKQSKSKGLFQ